MTLASLFRISIIAIILISTSFAQDSSSEEEISTGEESIEIDFLELNAKKESPPLENKNSGEPLKKTGKAKFIALNKITAKSEELSINIGESKYFYNINVKVHKCLRDANPYKPNNYLLTTIKESKKDEDEEVIFQGWLNSADISVSTLTHPIYEIFVKTCE